MNFALNLSHPLDAIRFKSIFSSTLPGEIIPCYEIAVFGLGYIGCVMGACLAQMGHVVHVVDISFAKVRMLNSGQSPALEQGQESLVGKMVAEGRFQTTLDPAEAFDRSDISLVAVGTPSRADGNANLDHVKLALADIGRCLRSAKKFHVVALRSIVRPGTTESLVIPTPEKASGKETGVDLGVCFNPEFLREGSSIQDFLTRPRGSSARATPGLHGSWCGCGNLVKAPLFVTYFKAVEILKYADNTFHALQAV